ncbi:hypothetical protein C0991_003491, partial [Blastosporella zonata]
MLPPATLKKALLHPAPTAHFFNPSAFCANGLNPGKSTLRMTLRPQWHLRSQVLFGEIPEENE